jgi:hypothetical protein
MTALARRYPLLFPGMLASASLAVIVLALSSWVFRSTSTRGRFDAWERANALGPGESFVWSALLLATNEKEPGKTPGELRALEGRMQRVFGYNQFKILAESENKISHEGERWFVPSENMYLGMTLKGKPKDSSQGVNLKIWRKQELLVDADARVHPGSPLFIRGPLKGKGQLIFVLMLSRLPETAAATRPDTHPPGDSEVAHPLANTIFIWRDDRCLPAVALCAKEGVVRSASPCVIPPAMKPGANS